MQHKLYAITDPDLLPSDALFTGVAAALRGGCQIIQYRDKKNSLAIKEENAKQLVRLCNQYNANLIINDDVELAKKVNAHGVHLGQGDMDPVAARFILGNQAIIGVTCHDSLELARFAIAKTANYIAFGRFFSSKTKPGAQAASLDLLTEARKEFGNFHIVAIGGITVENAQEVLAAGADIIAVCNDVFAVKDVEEKTKKFIKL
jgi:thiamine-phosphate pyrophosphorylase